MKYLAKYIVLILTVIFVQDTLAQDGDAVFNKIIKEYTLNTDGSTEYREYKEVKLLSHMSFHRLYGETFIVFDPEFQEIVINEAFTIMKDGKKVVVPDNAFNEVLPRAARNAAPYNHLRELVITHTGLEVGATIYLDYTIKTKAGYVQTFMGEEMIKDIVPIKEKKVIIRIPGNQELKYKVLNLRTGAQVSDEKGMKVYTFSFKGLSAYTREWGIDYKLLPRLFFSAAKDMERAYFPFVAQAAFTYQLTEDMTAVVNEIREENSDDLKAVLAIQKMVVRDIGTWNLPLEYAGFRCRTPEETWNSNAGTPLEKNVLLASLLMKVGYNAVPVAIIPEKYYDRTVGSLYVFDGFAVRVQVGSESIYLSATRSSSQDLAYGLKGNIFLVLDGAIESLKTYSPEAIASQITYVGGYELDDSGKLKGTLSILLNGNSNPWLKLYGDTAFAKTFESGAIDASIKEADRYRCHLELEISKENATEKYGDYEFINITDSKSGISSWGFNYIEAGRSTPIKLREEIFEQYDLFFNLPDSYDLITPEVNINIDNSVGVVHISIIKEEGGFVGIDRSIHIKKQMIKVSEFSELEALLDAWMNPSYRKLVFKTAE